MAEFLLELFSEEIPARMQARAEADLKRMVTDVLKAEGLKHGEVYTYSTPRRLTLVINDLPTSQPDVSEERRGPRADAPDQAIAGFLRGAGVERADLVEREDKKGTFLYAVIEKKGQATADILKSKIPDVVYKFPWPKSMKWGSEITADSNEITADQTIPLSGLRWVRPLKSILCLLGGQIIPLKIEKMYASNKTQGHRFLAPNSFEVKDFADYKAKLFDAKVMLDPKDRRNVIMNDSLAIVMKKNLQIGLNPNIVDEVVGLVEWPVVMMGSFDDNFRDIPAEALISEMEQHQKYFSVWQGIALQGKFVFVANIEGDAEVIRAGNERVLGARLSDAKFFWDQDCAKKLDDFLPALSNIVFHEKLGTVAERVNRCETLAARLAKFIPNCDADLAKRGAKLAKADLVSGMVGEFPDLQGVMGGYYAKAQGEDPTVTLAITEQYSPKGPADVCPTAPVSIAVAMADKLDSLIGFFANDLLPTGSKDPFALRRAALGVIRLITENKLRIGLKSDLGFEDNLLAFFMDRLKVQQKEKGVRHDLIDAVLSDEDDLVRLLNRVAALQNFLSTDDGENLLAGYKRASNILKIEEKKDQTRFDGNVDPSLLKDGAEKALFDQLGSAQSAANTAVSSEKFEDAMAAIAKLRAPIDAFFDDVIVNDDDADIRVNRLNLLAKIRSSLNAVADFRKVEG